MAIQAQVDDSTSEVAERKLFVAGHINTASNRILFSDAWRQDFNAAPTIGSLNISELDKQFRDWEAEVRDAGIKGLARVIRDFKPTSIHCVVSPRDLIESLEPVARYDFRHSSLRMFQGLMLDLARAQAESHNRFSKVPIDFIFEQQQELGQDARQFYELIREAYPGPIRACFSKSPIFGADKLVLPPQAAVICAGRILTENENEIERLGNPPSLLASTGGQYLAIALEAPPMEPRAKGFKQVPVTRFLRRNIARKKARRTGQRRIEQGTKPSRLIRLKNNLTYFATRIKNALLSFVGRPRPAP